jgi:putative FmdB family regulatory protein
MPIYDYRCSNCGQMTEVIHGIDAPAPRFCPACGAEGTLRKAFAAPAVLFKGSGWAKKDRSSSSASRTKAGAATASAESKDGAGKGSGAEGKGSADSKPTGGESASTSKSSGASED